MVNSNITNAINYKQIALNELSSLKNVIIKLKKSFSKILTISQ